MDLPCCEVPALQTMMQQISKKVMSVIGNTIDPKAAKALQPRSWKEPHLLRYQKVEGLPEHTGIKFHYDGSDLTWQLMLSDEESDYVGK